MERFSETLSQALKSSMHDGDRRLAAEVTAALLRRMHALGWSHGDLKGANIVVRRDGDGGLSAL